MLYALACASGAGALLLQLAWARWLALSLGAGAQALAVAAAGAMLGLAAGSELGGRLSRGGRRPLALYGSAELAAALLSLALTLLARRAAGPDGFAVHPLAAVLAIAVPNAAFGVSLPALAAHVGGGLKLSRLYSANTAGAVGGVLLAGFLLFERLGLTASALLGSSLCLLAGLAALSLRSSPAKPEAASESAPRWALLGAAASGFGALAYEALSARLLVHGLLATTHALAVILASFLAGLALGARLFRGEPRRALGLGLLGGAALGLALGPALAGTSAVAGVWRTAPWSLRVAGEALWAGALLVPAAALLGLALPAAMAAGGVGRVLFVNTLAGAAGSLLAVFVLLPALGLRGALAASALVPAAAGAWLLGGRAWLLAGGVALGGLLWTRAAAPLVPQHVVGRQADYDLLCYSEGPLATAAVLRHKATGRRDLVLDGFVAAGEAPGSGYMELMGTLPRLLHGRAEKVLVICFGTGATARAAKATTIVDLEPAVFDCAGAFGPENVDLLASADVRVQDGRRFLRDSSESYDVITQEPMPPHFAGSSSLYSTEYYALAARRLAPEGILVQWLPLHLVTPQDSRQIMAAALAVFPQTRLALAKDGTGLIVSSRSPIPESARKRAEKELGVKWALDPRSARLYAAGARPVSDDKPALEYSGIDRARGLYGTTGNLHLANLADITESR